MNNRVLAREPEGSPVSRKSRLDRSLSLFADVRGGEGLTVILMLVNIFLLLICYAVIKTVREPLILLGGGAEVRSYAAAGQAFVLMGFVPLYGWFASRVDRVKLLVGVTLFFIGCIELFAFAVAARVPFVGVAFFIWVGIFNISLVAQFWSFANDIYTKEAGDRLFPIIMIGMTGGAPLGSLIAARLFRVGLAPQVILQISVVLLALSVLLYLVLNRREERRDGQPAAASRVALSASGGFRLVLASPYLRLVALLIVLLNVVNTTGEYLVARLLSAHVQELALVDPGFNRQAYIGAFTGDYQFWVNITAFLLQAFVAARLVRFAGLRGVLLALPLIALGGYAIIAAGAGFTLVRWIKTAENATDYSIMNTARQLLWLPTSREEKYKAKQAIDTFFVRGGDVLSAAAVYAGTAVLHLSVAQFAVGNTLLTLGWIAMACLILRPERAVARAVRRPLAAALATIAIVIVAAPANAQETREETLAAERAAKALHLHPYEPDTLERRIERAEKAMITKRSIYPFVGGVYEGGGLAVGPALRGQFADTGAFDGHAAWSVRNFKSAGAAVRLPDFAQGRLSVDMHGDWMDAPRVAFYGVGNDTSRDQRTYFAFRTTTAGVTTRVRVTDLLGIGGGVDRVAIEAAGSLAPTYTRSRAFAQVDSRTSPLYTRHGGLYRVEWSDYRQTNSGLSSFRRIDAEAKQYLPLLRENWVIALRANVATTDTAGTNTVPFYLMPDLGGSHALRGYPSFRFRDRNRLLFSGEYRWTAGSFVDMALFLDAGKVAERFRDLSVDDLRTSYGIGASFHAPNATVLRVELARSREGNRVSLSFGPSF
jgi:AAA family ATP:ADP antiporter